MSSMTTLMSCSIYNIKRSIVALSPCTTNLLFTSKKLNSISIARNNNNININIIMLTRPEYPGKAPPEIPYVPKTNPEIDPSVPPEILTDPSRFEPYPNPKPDAPKPPLSPPGPDTPLPKPPDTLPPRPPDVVPPHPPGPDIVPPPTTPPDITPPTGPSIIL